MSDSLDEIIELEGMCIYRMPTHDCVSDDIKMAYIDGSGDAYNECAKLADKAKHELPIEIIKALRKAAFNQNITLNIAIEEVNKVFNTLG